MQYKEGTIGKRLHKKPILLRYEIHMLTQEKEKKPGAIIAVFVRFLDASITGRTMNVRPTILNYSIMIGLYPELSYRIFINYHPKSRNLHIWIFVGFDHDRQ